MLCERLPESVEPLLAWLNRPWYVREASEIRLVRIDIGNVTKHRIAGLVAGNSHSFHLTAYNFNGLESEPSNTFVYQVPAVANDLQPTIAVFGRYGFYGVMEVD